MANKSISQLDAGAAVSSTDLFPDVQTAGVGPVKVTAAQIGNYVLGGSGLTSVLPVVRGGTGVTTSTGTGSVVLGTSPTFTTSALFPAGTVGAPGISVSGDTNTGIYFPAADTIGFVEGGVESMRLDANGNVGIGTASPARPLHVYSASTSYIARFQNAGTALALINFKDSTTGDFTVGLGANGENLVFQTSTTERMRLDASGNLGLGVTPSAWSADRKVIQTGSGGSTNGSASVPNFIELGSNFYANAAGADTYIATSTASKYRQFAGAHTWWTAPSGTAGNAISFTQAMTLNASGDLTVSNTASPAFTVSGSTSAFNNTVSGSYSSQMVQYATGESYWQSSGTILEFGTTSSSPFTFKTNNAERMRITAAGNVGIGTTPSFPFTVGTTGTNGSYGIYLSTTSTTSTGSESFYGIGYVTVQYVSTGTTSNMTHNLYQGYIGISNNATTTYSDIFTVNPATLGASPSGTISSLKAFNIGSTSYQHTGTASITITNAYGLYVNNQAGVTTGVTKTAAYGIYIASQTGATTNYGIYSAGGKIVMQGVYDNTAGSANVSVDASGNLTRITSSLRYKKDIETSTRGLADALKLRAVTYKEKTGDGTIFGGFIAEEVDAAGLSEFVEYGPENSIESVRYGNMVSLAFKAIQELAAKVSALEAKQ